VTTPSPAEEIRAAAEKLRKRVTDLRDCRGPWYVVNRDQRPYPQRIDNIGVPYIVASTTTSPDHPPTIADYICTMHPGVGAVVADLLDKWAWLGGIEADLLNRVGGPEALTLARLINQTQE
jgi:hypothetical protein